MKYSYIINLFDKQKSGVISLQDLEVIRKKEGSRETYHQLGLPMIVAQHVETETYQIMLSEPIRLIAERHDIEILSVLTFFQAVDEKEELSHGPLFHSVCNFLLHCEKKYYSLKEWELYGYEDQDFSAFHAVKKIIEVGMFLNSKEDVIEFTKKEREAWKL